MKKLYSFYWDAGRSGHLDGLFIADEEEVALAIGQEVDFGEALGKHSEVLGELEVDDMEMKSDDQELITKLETVFGGLTICGYNPLEYLPGPFEDEDDENDPLGGEPDSLGG